MLINKLKNTIWKKLSQLKTGMKIAIENNGRLDWDEIVSIKSLGKQPVYDIEIEGKHNFVGNGIIAHNTIVAGNINPSADASYDLGDTTSSWRNLYLTGNLCFDDADCMGSSAIGGGWTDGGASVYLTTTADNVGIGTTAPASGSKLHVEGQCVEENSLIPVLTRSDLVKIKDIQSGDQVLSLNETTGEFEYQTVEKTLDMGTKEIYELITESGKKIETTGNHPYLARTSFSGENKITDGKSNYQKGKTNLGFDEKLIKINHFDFTVKTIDKYKEIIEANKLAVNTNELAVAKAAINQPAAKSQKNEEKTATVFDEENNFVINNTLSQQWVKVIYLKEGDEIATIDGFEKIVSIRILPPKHVYDLQIANTHNFVANGIIAHNTYISGNVGIGTTEPSEKLEVAGSSRFGTLSSASTAYFPTTELTTIGATPNLWIGARGAINNLAQIGLGYIAGTNPPNIIGHVATDANGNTTGDIFFATRSVTTDTAPTERMRITNAGNVGIGTTGPTSKLQVVGGDIGIDTDKTIWLSTSKDTGISEAAATGNIIYSVALANRAHVFNAGGTEVMRTINGNVGIGTTGPSEKLDVTGNIAVYNSGNDPVVKVGDVEGQDVMYLQYNSAGNYGSIQSYAGGTVGKLVLNGGGGNVGIGTTNPNGDLHITKGVTAGQVVFNTASTPTQANYDVGLYRWSGATGLYHAWHLTGGGTNEVDLQFQSVQSAAIGAVATPMVTFQQNGNVGIGTTGPTFKLDVAGNEQLSGVYPYLQFTPSGWSGGSVLQFGIDSAFGTTGDFGGVSMTTGKSFIVKTGGGSMVVDSAGNVGIGTAGPGQKLDVYGTVRYSAGPTSYGEIYQNVSDDSFYIANQRNAAGANLYLGTAYGAQLQAVTINQGNVGIGTTGPGAKLDIAASATDTIANRNFLRFSNIAGSPYYKIGLDGSGNLAIDSMTGPTNVMTLQLNGNVGIGTTGPGYKLAVNDATAQAQATFYGYSMYSARTAADSGTIRVGSNATYYGTMDYSGADQTYFTFDNAYDSASAKTQFRMRTLGTPVTAMTILGSGNVGIGTTGPGAKLDVHATSYYNSVANAGLKITNLAQPTRSLLLGFDYDNGDFGYIQADVTKTLLLNPNGGSIGIGMGTNPPSKLGVSGSVSIGSSYAGTAAPADGMIIQGNVGIGTTGPGQILDIFSATSDKARVRVTTTSTAAGGYSGYEFYGGAAGTTFGGGIYREQSTNNLDIYTQGDGNVPRVTIQNSGNVGIGTTSPDVNLYIKGAASANAVMTVDTTTTGYSSGIRLSEAGITKWTLVSVGTDDDFRINNAAGTTFVKVDQSSGNVGIGTVSPGSKLAVSGNAVIGSGYATSAGPTDGLAIQGNVGIGTTGPASKLSVSGNANVSGTFAIGSASAPNYPLEIITTSTNIINFNSASVRSWMQGVYRSGTTGGFFIRDDNAAADRLVIDTSGNVGIGTTAPGANLDISGNNVPTLKLTPSSDSSYYASMNARWDEEAFALIGGGYKLLTTGGYANPTTTYLWSNNAQTMTLKSGNVGIGTTGPVQKLTVVGGRMIAAAASENFAVGAQYVSTTGAFWMGATNAANADGVFSNGAGTPLVTMQYGGNVGIGTTGPGAKLEIGSGQIFVPTGSSAAPSYSFTGDSDTGLINPYADSIGFSGGGTERFRLDTGNLVLRLASNFRIAWDSGAVGSGFDTILYRDSADKLRTPDTLIIDGNVGIGTTNPLQKLHVEGQCVTGDSLLPILVNKPASEGSQDDSPAYSPASGDNSDSTIRGVHSAASEEESAAEGSEPSITSSHITNSGRSAEISRNRDIEPSSNRDTRRPSPAAQAAGGQVELTRIDQIRGGELVLSLNEQTGKLEPQKIKGLLDMGVKPVYKLTTQDGKTIRTTGNHPYLTKNKELFPETTENQNSGNSYKSQSNYSQINISASGHIASLSPQKEEPDKNQNNTADNSSKKIGINNIPFNHFFTPLASNIETAANAKAMINDTPKVKKNLDKLSGLTNKGEITPAENQATAILPTISEALPSWPTDNLPIKNNYNTVDKENVNMLALSETKWTKVIYLKIGDEIAVADSGEAKFVRITSIEELPAEQVWDIEVENTHNFVANGIIAHNTYISGNLGIGTTNPTTALYVNGAVTGDSFYDAQNASYYLNPASTGTALTVAGNIGIGNTSPSYKLDVAGDINFTGALREDGVEIFSGMITPFAGSCPTGWTEYTAARGRYIVGTPSGGTNAATVGTALTDQENRATGQHNHGITDPGHTHAYTGMEIQPPEDCSYLGSYRPVAVSMVTQSSTTGITINNAGSVAGTNAPYVQLTYCQKTAGSDLAEWIQSNEQIEKTNIVSVDPNNTERIITSNQEYDSKIIGIIASAPGWLIGTEGPNGVQMALAGRVPTKITLKNGEIKPGDPITTSTIPGTGMKATKAGAIVGKAMEAFNETSSNYDCQDPATGKDEKCGTILVFVNISWVDPANQTDTSMADNSQLFYDQVTFDDNFMDGNLANMAVSDSPQQYNSQVTDRVTHITKSVNFDKDSFVGIISTKIGGDGDLLRRERINNQTISETRLITSGRADALVSRTSENIDYGDPLTVSENEGMLKKASGPGMIIGRSLEKWDTSSGKEKIAINISPTIYLGEDVFITDTGDLKIIGQENNYAVAAPDNTIIDRIGAFAEVMAANLKAGLIQTQQLIADTLIVNNKILAPTVETEVLTTGFISPLPDNPVITIAADVSVSGELTAKSINSPTIDIMRQKIEDLVAQLNQPSAVPPDSTTIDVNTLNTLYELLNSQNQATASAQSLDIASVQADFGFFKDYLAVMGQATITDLSVTNTLSTASITSPAGSLNLLAGLMVLDQSGNVAINGNLIVNGEILAQKITAPQGHFEELLSQKLEVDEAKIKQLTTEGLTIALPLDASASAVATDSASITTNATAGKAILPAGLTEFTINSSHVTAETLIYVTPIGDSQNQVLYVKAKQVGAWFKVAINQPLSYNLEFNWWIIKMEPEKTI